MYQPHDDKPLYNQPPSTTGTGFPANFNSTTYSSATTTEYAPPPPKPLVEWSTGLCGCWSKYEQYEHCWWTFWCPCFTFGRVAEIIDKGSTSCCISGSLYALICCGFGSGYLYSCCYRSKMREQYGLKGNGCTDCLTHCCCEPCALSQEYRELANRGFNMDIGWHGNVEQQTRGIVMSTTSPAVESGMNR